MTTTSKWNHHKKQWQPDVTTGRRERDNNHLELFQKIDALVTACKENLEIPAILELLSFLKQYENGHFAVEGEFLKQYALFHTQDHLIQHNKLREALKTSLAKAYHLLRLSA